MKKHPKRGTRSVAFFVLLLATCAVMGGIFTFMAVFRYIDGDEGHFIFAARLVLEGKTPYTDFFYQQMPLMPYIYAGWFWLTDVSWYGARFFSALLGVASGLLLGWCVYKELRKPYAALAAILLYATNTVVFVWFSPVKVHSLSFFLLIAGYALWSYAPGRQRGILRFLVGLLIAFSLNIRLMMLVVIPGFYLDLWLNKELQQRRWTQALFFTLGLLVGCGMDYYFLAVCPECFFFDNIGYHAMRSGAGFIADFQQKLEIFYELTGVTLKYGLASFQQLCLTMASCAYFILMLRQKRITLDMSVLVLLTAVNLLPTPTFLQYFSVTVPFMVIQSVILFTRLWTRLQQPGVHVLACVLTLLLCLPYLAAVHDTCIGFSFTAPANGEQTIANMNATARFVDAINPERRPFLAEWPGFYVATESPEYPGLENNFAFEAAKGVDAHLRAKCKLFHPSQLAYLLQTDNMLVVVRAPDLTEMLSHFGYVLVRRMENSAIFAKKQ